MYKKSVIPKLFYKYNKISIIIQEGVLVKFDKLILKWIGKSKGPSIDKTAFKEKNTLGRQALLNIKTYYKATVTETVSE